jgi:hypothetical protein
MIPKYQARNERVIIFDPSRQEQYFQYPEITLDQVALMKGGVYRIHDCDPREFFKVIAESWRKTKEYGGLVICEDSSNFLTAQKNNDIYGILIGLRHINVDLVMITHSIMDTPGYIIRQLNEFVFFKTGDSWKDVADRFPDFVRSIAEAKFLEVMNHPLQYFCRVLTIHKTGSNHFL